MLTLVAAVLAYDRALDNCERVSSLSAYDPALDSPERVSLSAFRYAMSETRDEKDLMVGRRQGSLGCSE